MSINSYVRPNITADKITVQVVLNRRMFDGQEFEAAINRSVEDVALEIGALWQTEVETRMSGRNRDAYFGEGGIDVRITEKGNAVLAVEGKVAKALEFGYGPFDMKPGFANSSKLKDGKMVIPIDPGAKVFRIFSLSQMGSSAWTHPGLGGGSRGDLADGYQIIESIKPEAKRLLRETVERVWQEVYG